MKSRKSTQWTRVSAALTLALFLTSSTAFGSEETKSEEKPPREGKRFGFMLGFLSPNEPSFLQGHFLFQARPDLRITGSTNGFLSDGDSTAVGLKYITASDSALSPVVGAQFGRLHPRDFSYSWFGIDSQLAEARSFGSVSMEMEYQDKIGFTVSAGINALVYAPSEVKQRFFPTVSLGWMM